MRRRDVHGWSDSRASTIDTQTPSTASRSAASKIEPTHLTTWTLSEPPPPSPQQEKGFRDRKTGAFGISEDETREPGRTERLLAHPFAIRRAGAGDSWQALEGFLFFRVNGTSRVGTCYRLIVIGANLLLGVLTGLQPLLPPLTAAAFVQTFIILTLQLGMSFLCFYYLPDADRIISRFVGTQFFMEGLATIWLTSAGLISARAQSPYADAAAAATANQSTGSGGSSAGDVPADVEEVILELQMTGFFFSISAMAVPILQMVEQRCITPSYNLVKNKGGNPLALCAMAYTMVASMPRMVIRMVRSATAEDGGDDDNSDEGGDGEGGDGDGVAGEGFDEEGETLQQPDGQGIELSGEVAARAVARATLLLSRAVAAKEVAANKGASVEVLPIPMASENASGLRGMAMLGRMRNSLRTRQEEKRKSEAGNTDDVPDDDGGGGDDGGGD